jgi:hypothetical protein
MNDFEFARIQIGLATAEQAYRKILLRAIRHF